jgi:hypothetical protein
MELLHSKMFVKEFAVLLFQYLFMLKSRVFLIEAFDDTCFFQAFFFPKPRDYFGCSGLFSRLLAIFSAHVYRNRRA